MSTTLVTGGAGFIGSHLVRALRERGERVIIVDNFDPFYDSALKRENLRAAGVDPDGPDVVRVDITDETRIAEVMGSAKIETVVHLAARAGVRPSMRDPVGYALTNVIGTQVLLRHAGAARRVIVASSSSVYGNNAKTPFAETDPVDAPISPYAATKKACELIAHAHHAATGQPVACLRFFTVYGPAQRPDLAIMGFMRRLAAGGPVQMFGDGSMARDFTYVDDIVGGVLAAIDRIETHGYRVWNLGSDRPIRLDAMIAAIGRTLSVTPKIERLAVPAGDVERTWADLTRSRAELGYAPRVPFDEGLARQWSWVRRGSIA